MRFIFVKIILLYCILLPLDVWAQEAIRGVVRDSKEALVGVTVVWENKESRVVSGVTTNENGEFFLPVLPNGKELNIVFSFIGMKSKRVKYTGQKILNIILEDDQLTLDEVIVSAKIEHKNIMGINSDNVGVARQKINLDEFQDMAVTSVEDMLQGKMTNVDIIAGSGDPGTKMSIRIRGTSSLNASNEPLIVVDDVPQENIVIGDDFNFGTANEEDFGALINIAPSDIESIEVLKDAAATALWGSKAANGVLLITTKRGTKSKPYFSISQKNSISWEPQAIPMLSATEYVTLMQDALWNALQYNSFSPQKNHYLTGYKDIRYDPAYEYFDEFNQSTDWLSLVTRSPINNETNFSMSGGGDRATYRFSVGYLTEKGTTIKTDFARITARLNLDYNLSKRLKVTSSFSYAEGNRNKPYVPGKEPREQALLKMPNMSPWELDNNGNPTSVYFTPPSTCIQGVTTNPVAQVNDSKNNAISRDMNANFGLRYNILSGLNFSTDIAFGLNTTKTKTFYPEQASGDNWLDKDEEYNATQDGTSNNVSIFTNSRLVYSKTLDRNYFSVSFVVQTRENSSSGYKASIFGIGSGELADPSAGGTVKTNKGLVSSDSKNRQVGFMGSLHYSYNNRYNATMGIRSDATSQTGRTCRWGTFPTVSLQWRVNNEPFLKDIEWLSDVRVNGSWGQSGNAPQGSFTYVGTISPENSYMDNSAVKQDGMQLNNLKWETATSYNGGLKLGLLSDKVIFEFEYYKKTTKDLLQQNMGIPSATGFSSVAWYNSGRTENRGWEMTLNLNDIIKVNGFTVSLNNLNVARNRNRILELPNGKLELALSEGNGKYANKLIEGRPLGAFFGFNCLGVYQNVDETLARNADGQVMRDVYGKEMVTSVYGKKSVYPGDAKYADHNNDGIINKYDMVYLGNAMPILTGGGSVRIGYKGLSLRTSFHFRVGQKIINRTRINTEAMYGGDNQRRAVLKRWRYEGDDTDIPRALFQDGYNYLGSDRFVEDNSFLKCKDLTLSYNFPKQMLSKIGLQRLNIYMTTYNLFTITKYKGQDPETSIPGGLAQLAEDNSMTPRARKMALGLTVDF